jgi:hypothetical protein
MFVEFTRPVRRPRFCNQPMADTRLEASSLPWLSKKSVAIARLFAAADAIAITYGGQARCSPSAAYN